MNTLEFSSNCGFHFLIHAEEALRLRRESQFVTVNTKHSVWYIGKKRGLIEKWRGGLCIFFMFWMTSGDIFMRGILKDPFFIFRMAF